MTHTREHRWAKSDQRDRGNKAQHDARGTRGKKQTLRQKLRRTNVTQAGSKHGRPNRHRLDAGNTGTSLQHANNENYEHRIWTRTQTENIQQKLKVWNAGSWNCPQISFFVFQQFLFWSDHFLLRPPCTSVIWPSGFDSEIRGVIIHNKNTSMSEAAFLFSWTNQRKNCAVYTL